ncbi:hypothetical protein C8A00DRAFT_35937 [Chaetomidium leptoderma]|uniref:CCZ1/INTU/HSP4 first Longin domain-containing protein n=1 Tax=Chaetomidium leptoderma TaxID=669021 RepID=A0AAN6VHI6_9PEZI|nr:hypothetical protein C8A00DRAFT_35937 [Chaetomidium leptoderma]
MANLLASGIIPAQLGFLAIYNPSLGATDETVDDQIVYYASTNTQSSPRQRRHRTASVGRPTGSVSNAERNERLRQIGLAQGMVEFGKSFSGGKPVDSIDTERSRVVLHELEPGWWILASIDLTRLPLPPSKTSPIPAPSTPSPLPPAKGTTATTAPSPPPLKFDYSSREVKPAVLLLQDLLRAHSVFLLHNAPSLSSLLASATRPQFTTLLARYWDLFLSTWNVLLHGNPACNVFGGIKIAACGELGIGVGEEERGSGEREVLEGLADRVGGLVDLVVGRFGTEQVAPGKGKVGVEGWLGMGGEVGAEDGAVFLGAGALSTRSLGAVTCWMEDIYTWGGSAYGVADSSAGIALRTKRRKGAAGKKGATTVQTIPAGDDKKIQAAKGKPKRAEPGSSSDARAGDQNAQPGPGASEDAPADTGEAGAGMEKMFSYLKLGYGTYWSLGASSPATNSDADDEPATNPTGTADDTASQSSLKDLNAGCFLIGLSDQKDTGSEQPDSPGQTKPERPRTVTVELEAQGSQGREPDAVGSPSPDPNNSNRRNKTKTASLRPVIYVHRPFICVLLFQPDGDTTFPPWEELSQSLQTQLLPLHKFLLTSTAYRPEKPDVGIPATAAQSEIYDLVFDPHTRTIHSSIPNIPDPVLTTTESFPSSSSGVPAPPQQQQQQQPPVWTRVEALNTHGQILAMFAGTRGDVSALERTCKTSRGWWVVWNRVLEQRVARDGRQPSLGSSSSSSSSPDGEEEEEELVGDGDDGDDDGDGDDGRVLGRVGKEIFLVRRASDHAGAGVIRGVSGSYVGGGAGGWADGASRLAQGIGVDTRRYIEGLLSLDR